MKKIKTIKKHIEETTDIDKIICDICGEDVDFENMWEDNEININATIGTYYPESDDRDYYVIDVCKKCFLEKVKPLIENSLNVKFRRVDNSEKYKLHEEM